MRIVISEFISLDGVVQAPGAVEEYTDGGFRQPARPAGQPDTQQWGAKN